MSNTTNKTTRTTTDYSNLPFSFTFLSNDNIVCKRYFNVDSYDKNYFNNLRSLKYEDRTINMKNIDSQIHWTYEIKDMMDELTGMNNGYGKLGLIPSFLKGICENLAWNNYNPYNPYNAMDIKNIYEYEQNYTLVVSFKDKQIAKSTFSGNVFQPYSRKDLHIGKIIPQIVQTITNYLSTRTTETATV